MDNAFTALAERGDGWWVVQLEEEPGLLTQARRLDRIPDMVRDALKLFPELTDNPETATITVKVRGEESVS